MGEKPGWIVGLGGLWFMGHAVPGGQWMTHGVCRILALLCPAHHLQQWPEVGDTVLSQVCSDSRPGAQWLCWRDGLAGTSQS